MEVFPEILLLVFEIAVVYVLLLFLPVGEKASSRIKFNMVCRKNVHRFYHLLMRLKVHEEPTLGVDEVVHDPRRYLLQGCFRLEYQAVESIDGRWRQPSIVTMPTHTNDISYHIQLSINY
jgi:hypothetical protein